MKKVLAAILLFFPLAGRGEPLRPPPGPREEEAGTVTVTLGFGSVSFPAAALAPAPAETEKPGKRKACNFGTFSLNYRLAREGGRVAARKVSVRVRNEARFYEAETPALRRHEGVHQTINRVQAEKIEKELSGFSAGGDLKAAETLLRRRFREDLKAVEALQKEWDANDTFPDPPSGPRSGGAPATP